MAKSEDAVNVDRQHCLEDRHKVGAPWQDIANGGEGNQAGLSYHLL